MKKYFSTSVSTWVDADIDIELDDLASDLDAEHVAYLAEKKGLRFNVGPGDGDASIDRVVEEAYRAARAMAYRAARAMADCPAAIRDLLWKVHGRAI